MVYLPDHHADILDFLELRLKTGSQETRAHSVKTGVCMHDEFWRRLEKGDNWTLFDPYELKKVLDLDLNDLYDLKPLQEGETPNPTDHAFTYYFRKAEMSTELTMSKKIQAKLLYQGIFKSLKTSGTPYIINIDEANRKNPNKHAGVIYCSNLC